MTRAYGVSKHAITHQSENAGAAARHDGRTARVGETTRTTSGPDEGPSVRTPPPDVNMSDGGFGRAGAGHRHTRTMHTPPDRDQKQNCENRPSASDDGISVDEYSEMMTRGDGTIRSARSHFDIATLVLRTKSPDEAGHRHAVYILVCENQYNDGDHAVNRAVVKGHDLVVPNRSDELRAAGDAPIVFYVGYSRDVVHRLHNHINGNGGLITELFPPRRIANIKWFKEEDDARFAEYVHAGALQEEHPMAFVGGGR